MEKHTYTGHTKVFMLISLAIIAAALVMSLLGMGMNMGIDFTGGSLLRYDIGAQYEAADVEKALKAQGISEFQIAKLGSEETELQIRLKLVEDADALRGGLEKELKAKYPDMTFVSIDHVGAVAGRDLVRNAVISMLIVFACLLLYIGIRFDLYSGMAALLALLHDVCIMTAFMVFFRSVYQVNSSFIAALLTIVGYSINNTIVIFDRIRESVKLDAYKKVSRKAVVEHSVSTTISRTMNTTITTLITLVTLYIMGVDSIREFAFPLLVGMLAGTYSSVLLSGQIWAMWQDNNTFGRVKNLFHKKAKA
ncbi:MAG: protein translocase subunit SecF [Clostridia bacterium]